VNLLQNRNEWWGKGGHTQKSKIDYREGGEKNAVRISIVVPTLQGTIHPITDKVGP